jgi:hypothetical protein
MDMEVNHIILQVNCCIGLQFLGILHWNNVSGEEVQVEVPCLGLKLNSATLLISLAALHTSGSIEDVTPCTSWEVEISLILAESGRLHGEFKGTSEHDVMLLIIISLDILWEFKEEWLVEGTTVLVEHGQLGVVVSYHVVLNSHSASHNVQVGHAWAIDVVCENVWLLWWTVPSIVISGEWIESTKYVPSGAQLWSGGTNESADICAR